MKFISIIAIHVLFIFSFSACDEADDILNAGLTDGEIVQGLKEALNVGTDNAVISANQLDGYLKNEAIKILLPDQLKALQDQINTQSVVLISGVLEVPYRDILDAYIATNPNISADPFEELTVAMNRGAESAAIKAKPIFINAITGISVADGLGILQGNNTAATEYFQSSTASDLISAFQPDVKEALDMTSATTIYTSIQGFLNYEYDLISAYTIKVSDIIPTELPETLEGYATEEAVNGLFYLIGEEEKKIRTNPFDWASDIIAKVFGSREAQGG